MGILQSKPPLVTQVLVQVQLLLLKVTTCILLCPRKCPTKKLMFQNVQELKFIKLLLKLILMMMILILLQPQNQEIVCLMLTFQINMLTPEMLQLITMVLDLNCAINSMDNQIIFLLELEPVELLLVLVEKLKKLCLTVKLLVLTLTVLFQLCLNLQTQLLVMYQWKVLVTISYLELLIEKLSMTGKKQMIKLPYLWPEDQLDLKVYYVVELLEEPLVEPLNIQKKMDQIKMKTQKFVVLLGIISEIIQLNQFLNNIWQKKDYKISKLLLNLTIPQKENLLMPQTQKLFLNLPKNLLLVKLLLFSNKDILVSLFSKMENLILLEVYQKVNLWNVLQTNLQKEPILQVKHGLKNSPLLNTIKWIKLYYKDFQKEEKLYYQLKLQKVKLLYIKPLLKILFTQLQLIEKFEFYIITNNIIQFNLKLFNLQISVQKKLHSYKFFIILNSILFKQ